MLEGDESHGRYEFRQALRRRSRVAAKDELDAQKAQINARRIKAGRSLVKHFADHVGQAGLGDALVARYLDIPGRGDEYDLRSTVVDAIADILHFSRSRGVPAGHVIGALELGGSDVETDGIARTIDELRPVLANAGHDFEEALERAMDHVGVEAPGRRLM